MGLFNSATLCHIIEKENTMSNYKIKVYVDHGYFEYEVSDMSQAIGHGQAIMSSGVYRRETVNGEVEFHKPYKVKVKGEGLESEYKDKFVRT